jgi:hypothetical protein
MPQLTVCLSLFILLSVAVHGATGSTAQDAGLIPHLLRQGSVFTMTLAVCLEGLRDGVIGAVLGGILGLFGGHAKDGAALGFVGGALYGVISILHGMGLL